MPYSATPTGMRVLAGDYRDTDVRWARARRADKAAEGADKADKAAEGAEAAGRGAPTGDAAPSASTTRFARLRTLIPHAR